MTVLLIALAVAGAPPNDALPTFIERDSLTIQNQWKRVKQLEDPFEQTRLIRRQRLDRARCTDLLTLNQMISEIRLPLRLRDTVRGRTYARPEMLAVLISALRQLKKEQPKAVITVGDVAQPGCGQIQYGTLVNYVEGEEAAGLLKKATIRFGAPEILEPVMPDIFADEYPRFVGQLGPIWVERRLTGRSKSGVVRVQTRRFDSGELLGDASVARLLARTRQRIANRRHVTWKRVWHTLPTGRKVRLKTAQWYHVEQRRWIEVVWRHEHTRRFPIDQWSLLRIREARLDLRKPTSPKYEERYLFHSDGEAGMRVWRHNLAYEAHHSSHLAGFDADLSYITHGNVAHFEKGAPLNARATLKWLRTINKAAAKLRIPISAMFVSRSILNMLKRTPGARKTESLFRKLKLAAGHDSHVHLRVNPSPRFKGLTFEEVVKLTER